MTKDEMQLGCCKIYDDYSHLFMQIKIERIHFLEWLESFDKYDDVRKAHTYVISRLLKQLKDCQDTWRFHSPVAWMSLRATVPNITEIKTLDTKLRTFREVWKRKPKAPRKY